MDNSELLLFTADVESLYPSINIADGLVQLRLALKLYNNKHTDENEFDDEEIDYIIALTTWVLNNNYFEFGTNTIWKQIRGTAMGTPVAVTFACIYLGMLEREAFNAMPEFPFKMYKRYIDDIFGIPKSKELLEQFISILNNLRPTIKITTETSNSQINFLDITIFKGKLFKENNRFDIKVFQKPINKYVYLPPTSYHSKNVFKFITGELRRYRIICNNDSDYEEIKTLFRTRLEQRGYNNPTYLDNLMKTDSEFINNRTMLLLESELRQPRETDRVPILFKTTHNPRLKNLNLRTNLKIPEYLFQDPTTQQVFGRNANQIPLLCIKRSKNIKENICKSSHKYEIPEEMIIEIQKSMT
jgi:hypothetical protein